MKAYNPKEIEKKWQDRWEADGLYTATEDPQKKKFYGLVEFPYPSGDGLHTGHPRSFTAMDVIARKRRMEGYSVLYPMGWDAFGLPTENYAIKTGKQPAVITKENIATFKRQLKALGLSFDWSREVNTTDPRYYKWTQWIFLKMLKAGLAYKAKMPINWCPKCKIGLANEEAVGGVCERCGGPTEKREKEQWMLAITKYAERLHKDLDDVNYLERIKIQQRNWIGRSEGYEIEFEIRPTLSLPEGKGEFGYQTANPKTWQLLEEKALEMRNEPTEVESVLWDALQKNAITHHFRRQHVIGNFIVDFVCLKKRLVLEVDGDIHDSQKEDDEVRSEFLNERGFRVLRINNDEVLKSLTAVIKKISDELNTLPFGEGKGGAESVRVFTTRIDTLFGATYVVLAPEHPLLQSLDFENKSEVDQYVLVSKAKQEIDRTAVEKDKTGVELKGIKAINPANGEEVPVWVADYVLGHYGTGAVMAVPAHDERDRAFAEKYNLPSKPDAPEAGADVVEKVGATKKITYKLRDWVFSRQRYWGEPIPVVYCALDGIVPLDESELPLTLPPVENYQPTDNGDSPLAQIEEWVNTLCPTCGGPAKRETDTMPNWAGSSWYYLRYCDPDNENELASPEKLKYWTPIDWYNGGMEHTTLHLLYSRFWHKFLFDEGVVPTSEPYAKRTSQGMILASNGEKMSKSKGNVINPDAIVNQFGADAFRLYELFMGPFDQAIAWNSDSLAGVYRFIERVWNLKEKVSSSTLSLGEGKGGAELEILLNQTIKKVSEDIEEMKFNTAISSLMILVNKLGEQASISPETYQKLLLLLAPFTPHVVEELHSGSKSIHSEAWPTFDTSKLEKDTVEIVVQVNGKIRGRLATKRGLHENEAINMANSDAGIASWLKDTTVKKVVYVPDKLLNIVV